MNQRVRDIALTCFTGLLAAVVGCSAGKEYSTALKAEEKGAVQEAYDNYNKAAKKHPGNAAVVDGLKRTGPAAAAFWEGEALLAADEGRYADSWRMWMRALEIQPDDATAPSMIRQLEVQHPDQVAVAKTEYLRRGSSTLALAKPTGKGSLPSAASVLARADQANPQALTSDSPGGSEPEATPTAMAMAGDPPEAGEPPVENRVSQAPSPFNVRARGSKPPPPAKPEERVATGKPTILPNDFEKQPREQDQSASAGRVPSRDTTDRIYAPPPKAKEAARSKPPADSARPSKPVAPPGKPAERRTVPAPPSSSGEYASTLVLSKKDRRFPKQADLGDGIRVTIKDTDDDLDADLDLHDGKTRIKKVRSLAVGRSCIYRGHSGGYYRLTILEVYHKTRTTRIGIRPA